MLVVVVLLYWFSLFLFVLWCLLMYFVGKCLEFVLFEWWVVLIVMVCVGVVVCFWLCICVFCILIWVSIVLLWVIFFDL